MNTRRVLAVAALGAVLAVSLAAASRSPVAMADEPMSGLRIEPIALMPPVRAAALPAPVREARMTDYLYRLADELADAYADRHEDPDARRMRLMAWVRPVVQATQSEGLGPDVDWKYAATWFWIAHRETRLARRPRQLGSEDGGRAHGPLQVWTWRGMNPYAPETALDMLVHNPGAWSLPMRDPWIGYPDAAAWISEHPFELDPKAETP